VPKLAIELARRVLLTNIVRVKNVLRMENMSTPPTPPNPNLLGNLLFSLEFLPAHDPKRFESIDGCDEPNCTNRMRAELAIDALAAFQRACHMNEEANVAAADLICDLLHFVHSLNYSPIYVIESALTHFIAEAG
jgi:hypothetical protein